MKPPKYARRVRALLFIAAICVHTSAGYPAELIFNDSIPRQISLYRRPALLSATVWLADGDGVLAPGETAHLCLLVDNLSSGKAYGVAGYISGAIPALRVFLPSRWFASLAFL